MSETCACGHEADEHDNGHEHCTISGCRCVHYEQEGRDE